MFQNLVPLLRGDGVEQYLLEVIKGNTAALQLYQKQGFKETRQFACMTAAAEALKSHYSRHLAHPKCQIKQVDFPPAFSFEEFWDFHPSWQIKKMIF